MKLILYWPVVPYSPLNQPFGVRPDYYKKYGINGHNGLDFYSIHGRIARAAHDGIVVSAGDFGTAGWGVVIRTNESFDYNGGQSFFKSIYWHACTSTCHAGTHAIPVKVGQQVKIGDVLIYTDSTGDSSGDHLHFGLKPLIQSDDKYVFDNLDQHNGYNGAIDPYPFFGTISAATYGAVMFTHNFTTDIVFGEEDDEVKILQQALQLDGTFPLAQVCTGFYGKITEKAVQDFQKKYNIVTWGTPGTTGFGRCGSKTRAKLNYLYNK